MAGFRPILTTDSELILPESNVPRIVESAESTILRTGSGAASRFQNRRKRTGVVRVPDESSPTILARNGVRNRTPSARNCIRDFVASHERSLLPVFCQTYNPTLGFFDDSISSILVENSLIAQQLESVVVPLFVVSRSRRQRRHV